MSVLLPYKYDLLPGVWKNKPDPLEQFIEKKEYPELFGEESEFDFDIEHKEEVKLIPKEEFKEQLEAYKERVEKENNE